jgi:hypothetical protein
MNRLNKTGFGRQRGAAAVEFAIVAGVGGFLVLLIGIMELGRVLFYLNTASEATRLGARVAVVCDSDSTAIRTRMRGMLPLLRPEDISVSYVPSGCNSSASAARNSCQYVTVGIAAGVTVDTVIPFVPVSIDLPPFATTLPRESLNSTDNAICS